MNKFLLGTLLITLASCASLNKNMTKSGDARITGGVYKNSSWSSSLEFKRISWYHELTLLFDSLYAYVPEESEFRTWFSADERRRIRDCAQILVTINYAFDSEKISHALFNSQIRENKYHQIAAPSFVRSLKMHPDYQDLSLSLHKVNLFCQKTKLEDPIFINFPNFKELKL
ncbi:hypothetical protein [Bacteriovorax sp. DB6_IX]|uniref:hypothetical protein n=1 Tax=Bacteriovorax sp. DB6_IX TaxID=1353530 RepID=UPI00038A0364|nr:hypothetical protein [Bacteriovorax sp. DB6_IX]EQC52646.1 hypothetical protein M901_1403 [Bacteriovorax sp. DB6_IX]